MSSTSRHLRGAPHIALSSYSNRLALNIVKNPFLIVSSLFAILSASCSGPGGAPSFLENQNRSNGNVSEQNGANAFENLEEPGAQKLIYHVGPVNLMPSTSLEEQIDRPATLKFQVSEPVWVTGFKPEVIDANGNPLPGNLIYKAILFNGHDSNPICTSSNKGNPFAVATSTLTKVELPDGFGYPLLPDDPLVAEVIFQNPQPQDYLDVTFSFELETIPMDKTKSYSDVKAVLLDTDPCDHKPITLEPGAFVEQSKTFTLPEGGDLMVANGLLSNYGISVSLTHQREGAVSVLPFWRAEALLNEQHQIVDLTPNPFLDPEGIKIAGGDKMTLGVTFDNFSDSWNSTATGGAMIYLSPSQ